MKDPKYIKGLTLSFLLTSLVTLTSPFAKAAGDTGGVGNTGGGSTIDGKLVESYKKDLKDLPGYLSVVAPILFNLKQKLPGLGDLFSQTTTHLRFYVIPRKLHHLAEKITGLPFPADQTAIQKYNAVWIDQLNFQAMHKKVSGDREQGKLLIHEIALGAGLSVWEDDADKIMTVIYATTDALYDYYLAPDTQLANELASAGNWNIVVNGVPLLTTASAIAANKARQAQERAQSENEIRNLRAKELPIFKPAAEEFYNNVSQFCTVHLNDLPPNTSVWMYSFSRSQREKVSEILNDFYRSLYETRTSALFQVEDENFYGRVGMDVRDIDANKFDNTLKDWYRQIFFQTLSGDLAGELKSKWQDSVKDGKYGTPGLAADVGTHAYEFCRGSNIQRLRKALDEFYANELQKFPDLN